MSRLFNTSNGMQISRKEKSKPSSKGLIFYAPLKTDFHLEFGNELWNLKSSSGAFVIEDGYKCCKNAMVDFNPISGSVPLFLSCWIKFNSLDGIQNIVTSNRNNTNNNNLGFFSSGNLLKIGRYNAGYSSDISSCFTVETGRWYHLVGYNANNSPGPVSVVVNGNYVSNNSYNFWYTMYQSAYLNTIHIGCIDGFIHSIRFYNRILNQQEIVNLYNEFN